MSHHPAVAVVVLNYNGRRHLETCFDALLAQDYPEEAVELILVDNGSSDGSVDLMRTAYPGVTVVSNDKNLGFAAGNNVGIRYAVDVGSQYVALLNNDTRAAPNWLRSNVSTAESNRDAALCGSKIVAWDGSVIEFSGTVFYKETSAGGYTDEPDAGQYERVAGAAYACGAAVLIRNSAIREIGLFDEDFFCYHEDVDLSLRAWIAGYRVLYVPQSVVHHRRGGSSEGTAFRDYFGMRNALTTVLKCYEAKTWRESVHPILETYLHNSPRYLKMAFAYNMLWLPRTLRKRRRIQRSRRRSDAEMFSQFPHFRIRDGQHVWPAHASANSPSSYRQPSPGTSVADQNPVFSARGQNNLREDESAP